MNRAEAADRPHVTSIDQVAWQRRAAGLLTRILMRYPHLPPVSWTVAHAGSALTAEIPSLLPEAEIRDAWFAWVDVLALSATPGTTDPVTGTRHLRATGRRDGVRLVLTATIYAGDES